MAGCLEAYACIASIGCMRHNALHILLMQLSCFAVDPYCNATWDGFTCWLPTPANTTVTQQCPLLNNQMAINWTAIDQLAGAFNSSFANARSVLHDDL